MTSLTGKTEMKLKGTVQAPSLPVALCAAVVQVALLFYLWANHSSAGPCLRDPKTCLLDKPEEADPFGKEVVCVQLFSLFMWIVSVVKRKDGSSDPSLVDRLWSTAPIVYCWYAAITHPSPRAQVMAILVTLWGCRLTWNFYIKGGFAGGEDYRWEIIRSWFPGWKWEVFNFGFIIAFQMNVVFAMCAPALVAAGDSPLGPTDFAAAGLFGALLAVEYVADKQMFEFQTEKYARIGRGENLRELSKGFIDTGLWGLSRHPNYFAEMGMWWSIFLFTVSANGWRNWTLAGPVMLTMLFVPPGASIDLTETLSSRKYPDFGGLPETRIAPHPVVSKGMMRELYRGRHWRI